MQVFVLSGILSGYSGRADQGKSMQEPQGCHRPLTAFVDHLTSCTNFIPIHSEYHWLPGQNGWLNCTAVGGGECGDGDTRKWVQAVFPGENVAASSLGKCPGWALGPSVVFCRSSRQRKPLSPIFHRPLLPPSFPWKVTSKADLEH